MKIGIAVTTTPCRKSVFDSWLSYYQKSFSLSHLYVHHDIEYKGIVYSKNRCIDELYNRGCDYIFLFDDDLSIVDWRFVGSYINSGLEHACWNYNRQWIKFGVLAQTNIAIPTMEYLPPYPNLDSIKEFYEYDKPNGCMLYATRKVIDKVGGWDTAFKGYGYDHVNWSDRIFNNGLTPARYIDIPNSSRLFKMADCETSVSADIRASTIPDNYQLYLERFYSKEFKPFK